MFSQLIIFFLFFGGLSGLLFTSFLLLKRLHSSGNLSLLIYFCVMLLQITLKLMDESWLIDNWHVLYELSFQLPFLYGPLMYLFMRQLVHRQSFRQHDLIHFIPFAIVVFFCVVGYTNAESPLMLFPFLLAKFRLLFQLVSLYLYHWLALQCWKEHRQSFQRFSFFQSFKSLWLMKFAYTSFFVCAAVVFLNYFMVLLSPGLDYISSGFAVLVFFIFWVSYHALRHREVFGVVRGSKAKSITHEEDLPRLKIHPPANNT